MKSFTDVSWQTSLVGFPRVRRQTFRPVSELLCPKGGDWHSAVSSVSTRLRITHGEQTNWTILCDDHIAVDPAPAAPALPFFALHCQPAESVSCRHQGCLETMNKSWMLEPQGFLVGHTGSSSAFLTPDGRKGRWRLYPQKHCKNLICFGILKKI